MNLIFIGNDKLRNYNLETVIFLSFFLFEVFYFVPMCNLERKNTNKAPIFLYEIARKKSHVLEVKTLIYNINTVT